MSAVTVRELPGTEHDRWLELVSRSPDGSVYATPEYLGALCEAIGGRVRVLTACRGRELVGGVALFERSTPLGRFVAPRLLLYYNGLVLRDYETKYPSERTARRLEALTALAAELEGAGYGRLALRSRSTVTDVRPFLARGWAVAASYTYVVPLTDLEAQWGRVEQNLRRLIDRCAEQGVEVAADEDFDAFFRLHAETHERKGAPLYLPHDAFRQFVGRLRQKGLCRLYHARLPDGRPIASQLVLLGPHPVAHNVSAAADARHLRLGATAFLRWRVFEDLARLGYTANDLTDASLNSVTRFKSQLGGDLEVCFTVSRPDRPLFRAGWEARFAGRRARERLRRRAGGSETE